MRGGIVPPKTGTNGDSSNNPEGRISLISLRIKSRDAVKVKKWKSEKLKKRKYAKWTLKKLKKKKKTWVVKKW